MNMIKDQIGIDATRIRNIEVRSINLEKLFSDQYNGVNNKVKRLSGDRYVNEETGEIIPSFQINDNLFFGEFIVRIVPDYKQVNGTTKRMYTYMKIGAGHVYMDNRNNISIEVYRQYLEEIVVYYMEERYGIEICFQDAEFEELEINVTISIMGEFSKYRRVLSLFESNLPGRGYFMSTKNKSNTAGKESNQYGKFNNSEVFVMYNKSRAIREKYRNQREREKEKSKLFLKAQFSPNQAYKEFMTRLYDQFESNIECEECIRFEVRLFNKGKDRSRGTSTNKIERFLNIEKASIRRITDSKIKVCYEKYLEKMLLKPFCKWYQKDTQYLRDLVKKYKTRYKNAWQVYFYSRLWEEEIQRETLVLIDFRHLKDVLNFKIKSRNIDMKHNRTTVLKSFIERAKKYEDGNLFLENDSDKIIEVFDKLKFDYQELFVENSIDLIPKQLRKEKNND